MTHISNQDIAETFIRSCPVGWGIDSGYESLVRHPDLNGDPCWLATWEDGFLGVVTISEAAQFLLCEQGFGEYDGIEDLKERLRTGILGGGT